jgi:hypothetical protein
MLHGNFKLKLLYGAWELQYCINVMKLNAVW